MMLMLFIKTKFCEVMLSIFDGTKTKVLALLSDKILG